MKNIVVPVQLIGGTLDLLAPPDSMLKLQQCLSYAQLSTFGKMYGHSTDYGHGDLILGNAAPFEVFPLVAQFISKVATPIQAVPIQETHISMAPFDASNSLISR